MTSLFNTDTFRKWRLSRAADDRRTIEIAPSDSPEVRAFAESLRALNSRLGNPRGQCRVAPPAGLSLRVADALRDSTLAPSPVKRGNVVAWSAVAAAVAVLAAGLWVLRAPRSPDAPIVASKPPQALIRFPSMPSISERSVAALTSAVETPLRREADAIASDTRQAAQLFVDQLPLRLAISK